MVRLAALAKRFAFARCSEAAGYADGIFVQINRVRREATAGVLSGWKIGKAISHIRRP